MSKELLNNILAGVLTLALAGAYGFIWSVNNRLTVMENSTDELHTRSHAVIECKLRITPECRTESEEI